MQNKAFDMEQLKQGLKDKLERKLSESIKIEEDYEKSVLSQKDMKKAYSLDAENLYE